MAGVFGRVCLCARSASTPPTLAGFPGACVWVQVLASTPPILAGVLGCVRQCGRSACTQPVLAGVRGAGMCAWPRVSSAACDSWLGLCGLWVCVCALPVPSQSWPGLVVRLFGFRLWFSPYQSWLVCWRVCVCVRAPLAGVCSAGVCAWVRVSAAPRQSWLGWWGEGVLGHAAAPQQGECTCCVVGRSAHSWFRYNFMISIARGLANTSVKISCSSCAIPCARHRA